MSDQWEMYPCTIGGHAAFISYDHGVGRQLDALPFPNHVGFRIRLDAPDERGLPTRDEFAKLDMLEDYLVGQFRDGQGMQVGRVTYGGRRDLHFYAACGEDECLAIADRAASACGYRIEVRFEPDPAHTAYWDELYPTAEDWQVITDRRLEDTLRSHGDSLLQSRTIEHWAYFKSAAARDAFVEDVAHLAQCVDRHALSDGRDEPFAAKLAHEGQPDYHSMNPITLGLLRAARRHDGSYDGWETMVCRDAAGAA